MIEIKNLSKEYGSEKVLNSVSLRVKKGEFAFLRGKSGSGKSTLLKILYQDLRDFSGDVLIGGVSIRQMPRHELRRAVSVIFQSFELLEKKTALENVALAGEVAGRKEDEIEAEATALLKRVGLEGKENRFPHQLSGGEQQRVAVARALLNHPKALLADEPTGNLDPENAENVMRLLKEISEEKNIAMLVVTHSEELTKLFKASSLRMENGEVKKG